MNTNLVLRLIAAARIKFANIANKEKIYMCRLKKR